ncbi:MAG TPA: tetratricopeptide repeat protein [Methylophilaceae bacterium]|nr:tetratricopeptide repeat protein [Methylophilaceae bacterium]
MKPQFQPARQPSQMEVQPLLNLLNSGQLPQAEHMAKSLLQRYPAAFILHNVLGLALEGQQRYPEAEQVYRMAIQIDGKIGEIHFNLGVVLANQGKSEDAIGSYRKAIALKPNLAVAHFNLGIALQGLGRNEEATAAYRKAIGYEPGFYEAYGNLGAVLQAQGRLEDAVSAYRKAIAIHADARGYFNLGTALRNQGAAQEAIGCFNQALALDPRFVDAWTNLGDVFFHQGKANEALDCYGKALSIDPSHPATNYNLGIFYYDGGELEKAIPCFQAAGIADWRERTLYCFYKTGQYDAFREGMQAMLNEPHLSPFLATLSTHYATNFGTEDVYDFCKTPMDFVFHSQITELVGEDSSLRAELIRDIEQAEIAERKQGRLHNGIQSSGNLFKRPEASFRKLAELVKRQVQAYQAAFAGADNSLMRHFPREIEFSSSWYVKMRQGGHLTSHIHEEGWLSGSLYLSMPTRAPGSDAGSIEFSTHGDDYPQQHTDFPRRAIAPSVGDIVIFPSSLFHRTIPFEADEARICIAFDIRPNEPSSVSSLMSGN